MLYHITIGYLFIYKTFLGGVCKCFLKQNDRNIGGMNMLKKELCGDCRSIMQAKKEEVNYSSQFMSTIAHVRRQNLV